MHLYCLCTDQHLANMIILFRLPTFLLHIWISERNLQRNLIISMPAHLPSSILCSAFYLGLSAAILTKEKWQQCQPEYPLETLQRCLEYESFPLQFWDRECKERAYTVPTKKGAITQVHCCPTWLCDLMLLYLIRKRVCVFAVKE